MPERVVERVCSEIASIVSEDAELRLLGDGFEFLEGPVWWPAAGGLIFSDIPADAMYLWRAEHGVTRWRSPSHHANGNTVDPQGRLVTCEHGSRSVTRTPVPNASRTVLADQHHSLRLNSPNDIVVQRDGTIWFTDPPYGIRPEQMEQPCSYVYRMVPGDGPEPAADDFVKPNGICFSPDEQTLYVSDTGDSRRHIRIFKVQDDRSLVDNGVLRVFDVGKSDGFRVDTQGRIFTSAGDGIWVLDPTGSLLGKILVPETPSNCAFGGGAHETLFITARTGLYAIDLLVRGATAS